MGEKTPLRSRTVMANGLRMHVTEAGEGAPVLLLHGFPQSWREWAPVMTALGREMRLIAPDMRGAGATAAPSDGYDSATVQQDVIALVDELGLGQVDLVAHDWSALVGFDLCLDHPERIRRFIAIAVPAPYLRMTPALAAAMTKAMPQLWFQWVIAAPGLGPRLLSHGTQRLARWLLRSFAVQPMDAADVEAYMAALREPERAKAASRLYRRLILPGFAAMMRGAYRGRVLRTPTLVLFGAADALIPRDALAAGPDDAPHTSVEFVPAAGHFAVDDNPAEVTRRIGAFLTAPAIRTAQDLTPEEGT